MAGFYRKFVKNFAAIILPFSEKMRLYPNEKSMELDSREKQSFDEINVVLCSVEPLAYSQSSVTNYQLVIDSSKFTVGAALHQMVNGEPVPIGLFF